MVVFSGAATIQEHFVLATGILKRVRKYRNCGKVTRLIHLFRQS
jgi:hypothetical protein